MIGVKILNSLSDPRPLLQTTSALNQLVNEFMKLPELRGLRKQMQQKANAAESRVNLIMTRDSPLGTFFSELES